MGRTLEANGTAESIGEGKACMRLHSKSCYRMWRCWGVACSVVMHGPCVLRLVGVKHHNASVLAKIVHNVKVIDQMLIGVGNHRATLTWLPKRLVILSHEQ